MFTLVAVTVALSRAPPDDTKTCPEVGGSFVRIEALPHTEQLSLAPAEFAALARSLAGGAALELCGDDASGTRAGSLAIRLIDTTSVLVSMEDAVSGRRLERRLELADLPMDARAFAVAVVVAELSRALWPRAAPMPEARPSKGGARPTPGLSRLGPPPGRRGAGWLLGMGYASEHHAGGQQLFGLDAFGGFASLRRVVGFEARLGYRHALPESAPDGTIRGQAVVLGGGPTMALTDPRGRVALYLVLRADLLVLLFAGDPRDGARGRRGQAITAWCGGGLMARARLTGRISLRMAVLGGGVTDPVDAVDGRYRITGVSGGSAAVSLGVEFWP